jgi:hypothetical protein
MEKYGELKALIAGTTSKVSAAVPARSCYGSLARTIDQATNDLGADYIQVNTIFPNTAAADQILRALRRRIDACLPGQCRRGHQRGLPEHTFTQWERLTTVVGCLYAPQTAIVHGTALGDAQFTLMAASGMSLVWLPHSDVSLYDQSANVPLARTKGINVSLGINWSITGSHNLLDELRFADQIDNARWWRHAFALRSGPDGGRRMRRRHCIFDRTHSARSDVGKKADLTVVSAHVPIRGRRWSMLARAIFASCSSAGSPCTATLSCSRRRHPHPAARRWMCVAHRSLPAWPSPAARSRNKFGQTYTEILATLTNGFAAYDAMALTPWTFAPVTPFLDCP